MGNKAIYMQGIGNMGWKENEMPTPAAEDVLVRVDVVGICGSDVHYFNHGRIGDFVVEGDFILGHECAGVVEAVGPSVTTLAVGDRVALEPGKTCGKCHFCKTGKYNLCKKVEFFATPPYHGVLQNYVTHPAEMCFKLPENVSNMEGALVEPLAVGLHAAAMGRVSLGDTVVIFGAGCIGLVTLLASKARGAAKVIVVDVQKKRLDKALELGADAVVNPMTEKTVDVISTLTGGNGARVVIDTAGAKVTLQQTVEVLMGGGTIVLVGMTPDAETSFDFMKLMGKEGELRTIFRYRNLYPVAINAISSGAIDVKKIVSHEFDFDQTKEAFDFVSNHAADVVKAVIHIK